MAAGAKDIRDVQKEELEESTSCCICTEMYKRPKLLPCGHTFCLNCIQENGIQTSKGPGDEMPCPFCRQKFKIPSDGFAVLQNNYYVEGLIRVAQILNPSVAASTACDACLEENQEEACKEFQRAEMYCCDCKQKLCQECCRHHRKLKLTKNHSLIPINEQRATDEYLIHSQVPSVCEFHKQKDLEVYCCVCKTVACSICFFEKHEGHKGTHVSKAVDEFRKEIACNIEKVKTCISQAKMKKSEIAKAKQDAQKRLGSLESDIISRRDGLREVVDKHANELLEELSSIRQSIMKAVQIETDDIYAHLSRLESYNSYCNKITTKGSVFDICSSVGDLAARVTELQRENQPLKAQKLKPFTLCFIQTDFELEAKGNMIGQLKGVRNMNGYAVKIEGLWRDVTTSDVSRHLGWPHVDVLENVDISYGPMSTAFLILPRPDFAYKFLNFDKPTMDGRRVIISPEPFEEMSITLKGSWLGEIENDDPTIQIEIQEIADKFDLKLIYQKPVHGEAGTISLAGIPWRIELARECLNDKLQAIIMKRAGILKKLTKANCAQPLRGNQLDRSTNIDGQHNIKDHRKPLLKFEDPQSFSPMNQMWKVKDPMMFTRNPSNKRVPVLPLRTGKTYSAMTTSERINRKK